MLVRGVYSARREDGRGGAREGRTKEGDAYEPMGGGSGGDEGGGEGQERLEMTRRRNFDQRAPNIKISSPLFPERSATMAKSH